MSLPHRSTRRCARWVCPGTEGTELSASHLDGRRGAPSRYNARPSPVNPPERTTAPPQTPPMPPMPPPATSAARTQHASAARLRQLGLELHEELGAGSSGTVFRAVLLEPAFDLAAGAEVAVKVLKP